MSQINKLLLFVLGIISLFFIVNLAQNKISQTTTENNSPQSNAIAPKKDKFISQENEGESVTVTVKPKILEVGEKPTFEVEFNTHSVELSFAIEKLSFLTDDKGKTFNQPVWNGSPPGGHHRSGTLTFSKILSETKYVELVIKDVAGISERKFRFEL